MVLTHGLLSSLSFSAVVRPFGGHDCSQRSGLWIQLAVHRQRHWICRKLVTARLYFLPSPHFHGRQPGQGVVQSLHDGQAPPPLFWRLSTLKPYPGKPLQWLTTHDPAQGRCHTSDHCSLHHSFFRFPSAFTMHVSGWSHALHKIA